MASTSVCGDFIEREKRGGSKALESSMTEVTETPMPKCGVCGGSGESAWRRGDGVEVTRATAPENHGPYPEILHRKTPRVKFNRTKIVSGKLTDGNKIFNNARSNENVTKRERVREELVEREACPE